MTDQAALARDREIARELHPEDMDRLNAYAHRLRTNFRPTFNYLLGRGQLIPIDPSSGHFLLVHHYTTSKVALHIWCDEATEQVVELAVVDPGPRPFVEVLHDRRTKQPPVADCQNECIGSLPEPTGGVDNAKDQERRSQRDHARTSTHSNSMFWGFGYDHTTRRHSRGS